jgi:hypothetical protein
MDDPLPPKKTRNVNLDVLRGFFVSLALLQHFAYYWNIWFIDHFKDHDRGVFSFYNDLVGKNIILEDPIAFHLLVFFTPWVSQVYLSLAAFNLSFRDHHDFIRVFPKKIKIFISLFIFFVFENFLVAATFGEAISFYPLMSWMVILTLIATVYKFFNIKGVIILFILSLLSWSTSDIFIWGDQFERFVRFNVHPYFEYDARIEYFLPSGCIGFLLGHLHFHKEKWGDARYFFAMAFGVIIIGVYNIFGEPFTLNRFDILATEHDLAETFFGTLNIIGINSFVIMLFSMLNQKNIHLAFLKPLKWIGINSLLIFGLHRILFVHLIAPIRVYLGAVFNWPIYPSFFNELTHLIIVCFIVYLIQKSNIIELFRRQN